MKQTNGESSDLAKQVATQPVKRSAEGAKRNAQKDLDDWYIKNPDWESNEREKYMRGAEKECTKHMEKMKAGKLNAYYLYHLNN